MLRRSAYKPRCAYPKDWSVLLTLEFPEGNSDPLARRRLCPRGHNLPQPMAHRLGSEIELVVPLDLGHFQKRVNVVAGAPAVDSAGKPLAKEPKPRILRIPLE